MADEHSFIRLCWSSVKDRPKSSSSFVELQGELFSGEDYELLRVFERGSTDHEYLKLVYRKYSSLYILFLVDSTESELGMLDLIQVLVEALDQKFGNVCELDLIFHSTEAQWVLDEIICGGLVAETSLKEINRITKQIEKLDSAFRRRLGDRNSRSS